MKKKKTQQSQIYSTGWITCMPTTPEIMLFTDDGFLYHTSRMNNELHNSLESKSSSYEDYHNSAAKADNFTDFVTLG